MKHKFDETLSDFLEGHLSYCEADKRLRDVSLEPDQAQMWNELKPIDEGLAERTAKRAELPWLVTKVTSRVHATQRAKDWFKLHKDDMFGGFSFQYSQFFTPTVWKVLGAVVIGAFTGFMLGSKVAYLQQYQSMLPKGISFPLLLAVSLGLVAALVVVSPLLRKYYS